MCGIFYVQCFFKNIDSVTKRHNKHQISDLELFQNDFSSMIHRGPDNSSFLNDAQPEKDYAAIWGFHRLAINGQTPESNQPFFIKNCRRNYVSPHARERFKYV